MKKIFKLTIALICIIVFFASCKAREKCPAYQSKVNTSTSKTA